MDRMSEPVQQNFCRPSSKDCVHFQSKTLVAGEVTKYAGSFVSLAKGASSIQTCIIVPHSRIETSCLPSPINLPDSTRARNASLNKHHYLHIKPTAKVVRKIGADVGFVDDQLYELGATVGDMLWKPRLSDEGYDRSVEIFFCNETNETLHYDNDRFEDGQWYPKRSHRSEIPPEKMATWIAVSPKDQGGTAINRSCWIKIGDGGVDQLNFDFENGSLADRNEWRVYTNNGARYDVSRDGNDDHDAICSIKLQYK